MPNGIRYGSVRVYKTSCGNRRLEISDMKSPSILRLATLSALLPIFLLARGQGDPATLDRIADQGKNHSQIVDRLHTVCFDIGARLTSSPELYKGQKWALAQFKKFGCTNVHLEKWGEFPVGFDRGPVQICRMVEPFESDMQFTTPAWATARTVWRGGGHAPASDPGGRSRHSSEIRGKWLVAPMDAGV